MLIKQGYSNICYDVVNIQELFLNEIQNNTLFLSKNSLKRPYVFPVILHYSSHSDFKKDSLVFAQHFLILQKPLERIIVKNRLSENRTRYIIISTVNTCINVVIV